MGEGGDTSERAVSVCVVYEKTKGKRIKSERVDERIPLWGLRALEREKSSEMLCTLMLVNSPF